MCTRSLGRRPGWRGRAGVAGLALLAAPQGVAVDAAGNLYIADTGNNRIQEIAKASGTISTVAGSASGSSGSSGDGGAATAALLKSPAGITLSTGGDLYIADTGNNRVQKVAAASGTISTVAGSAAGVSGLSGDGGAATAALLKAPGGVALSGAGDLYIADTGNNRVQKVVASSGIISTFAGSATGTSGHTGDGTPAASALLNSGNQTYTFTPAPGTIYTYGWNGALTGESDAAGDTLPGTGGCPSAAVTCETITAASGRALVIGSDVNGLITSVTDPLGRQWTYGYTGPDLTLVTDPLGHKTSYAYGPGSTGGPLQANDLLTITSPNAQPGGPNAGAATVNVFDAAGRVTSQTDPMGHVTTFNYCVNAADGDCMNAATGTGAVTVTGPDGNTTVDAYIQGTLVAESVWTGTTLTSEHDYVPVTTAGGASGGTLLDAASTDGNGNLTTDTYDPAGNVVSETSP